MKKEILKEIVNIANILDSSGFIREANVLDSIAKRVKVAGFFGNKDGGSVGFFGSSSSSSVNQLRDYIFSQCDGDSEDIFLWSQGKSIVDNPPKEIRNIIMNMNPKITGNRYLFDNIYAKGYFKNWIRNRSLGDEAFYYILDNNEEYLNLYRNFGRPTQKQNVHIIRMLESENLDDYGIDALRETEDEFEIERLPAENRRDNYRLRNEGGFFGGSGGRGGFFGGSGGRSGGGGNRR
jgi:hypothetical protein